MSESERLLIAVCRITQVAMALVLGGLLFAFYRAYKRSYLRSWGLAWFAHALSLAATAFIVRYMARPGVPVTWWSLGVPWISQFSAYLQILWLFQGTRALASGASSSKRHTRGFLVLSCVLATAVLVPRFIFGESMWTMFVVRIGVRSLVAGLAFLTTAALISRVPSRSGGLARKMVRISFAAYAVLELCYAFHTVATALKYVSLGSIAYVGFVDLVLCTTLGVSLLSWMLEDERSRADEHADAAQRAESSLHAQENRFRRLIENVSDVITVVDWSGTIRYASPAVTRVLGYEQHEWLGTRTADLLHREEYQAAQAAISAVLGEPDHVQRATWRYRHKDGSYRVLESELSGLPSDGGKLEVVINSRDVTERRALEQKVTRIQRLDELGRLAGGVAHDFNNLLTVIFGSAAVAKEQIAPSHSVTRELEQIEQTASRAATLTRQLLTFARQDAGQARVLDLNRLVRDILTLLRRLIGEDIRLIDRTAAEAALVRADPGQIEQVIVNLAVNGRDAMPKGGQLSIEVREWQPAADSFPGGEKLGPGKYVELTVRDTGTGILPEVRDHIFEPFFTTKEPGKGTGLGLSTSYGIVRQHGGHVWCEDAAGGGTAFRVLLPMCTEAEASTASLATGAARRGHGETILIVEDDHRVRETSTRTLRDHGYRVLEAADGEQALALALGPHGLDLVMTDLVMPNIGGVDLADRLREKRPGVRVVFTTGYSARKDLERVRADSLLRKPFSPGDLLLFVRGQLSPRAAVETADEAESGRTRT